MSAQGTSAVPIPSPRPPARKATARFTRTSTTTQVKRHFLRRGHGVEFEMEVDWIRAHLPPGSGRVADVGCGIGSLFDVIGTPRVIGLDLCAEGLAHTRVRFPSVPLLCADASRLPFADASLDAVTAQHVVEHLPFHEEACCEWYRVLRPGGVLVLLTPNAMFRDPSVFADDTHVHVFDSRELRGVLVRAGFTIVDQRSIGLPWFRHHGRVVAGWRLRRLVTRRAGFLSMFPHWRWKGQTLCFTARRGSS